MNENKLTRNPWLSMWLEPRATMREILDRNPRYRVILLALIGGIATTYDRISSQPTYEHDTIWQVLPLLLIGGPIFGLIGLYVFGAILKWTGSWIGGTGSYEEVRAAVAWSNVPMIWGLILIVPNLLLYGEHLFETDNLNSVLTHVAIAIPAIILMLIELTLAVWAFVIYLKCLAEAHCFSAWKALGAVLIPIAILIVLGVALGLMGLVIGSLF